MLKVDLHMITWNEEKLLPLVLRHYKKFCDAIYIYDNFSTDNTAQIAHDEGAIVSQFGIKGKLDDLEYLKIKNHCWKGSEADYVIVCDADEVLWDDMITLKLGMARMKGSTMFDTKGYNIYSQTWPELNILEVSRGIEDDAYAKNIIFDPSAIKEINYKPGAHVCKPSGQVVISEYSLYVLHYRNLGPFEDILSRRREYHSRLSHSNKTKGYGTHYSWSEAKIRKEYDEKYAKSKTLINDNIQSFR